MILDTRSLFVIHGFNIKNPITAYTRRESRVSHLFLNFKPKLIIINQRNKFKAVTKSAYNNLLLKY